MRYRVFLKDGGPYTETDDAEAALDLMKLCSNGHRPRTLDLETEVEKALNKIPDRDLNVWNFFLHINDNARKLLLVLMNYKAGIRGEKYSEETGFPADKLGGIFGGASKIAKGNALKIDSFVDSKQIVKGTERYRFYKPGPLLLEYGDKLKEVSRGKGIAF